MPSHCTEAWRSRAKVQAVPQPFEMANCAAARAALVGYRRRCAGVARCSAGRRSADRQRHHRHGRADVRAGPSSNRRRLARKHGAKRPSSPVSRRVPRPVADLGPSECSSFRIALSSTLSANSGLSLLFSSSSSRSPGHRTLNPAALRFQLVERHRAQPVLVTHHDCGRTSFLLLDHPDNVPRRNGSSSRRGKLYIRSREPTGVGHREWFRIKLTGSICNQGWIQPLRVNLPAAAGKSSSVIQSTDHRRSTKEHEELAGFEHIPADHC